MAGVISFKVYLREDEKSSIKEVRRFGIDSDAVTNFVYLQEKLQTVFPTLMRKRFNIFWKDSDGDLISISSDEELILALNETALEPTRKLYVEIQSNDNSDCGPKPSNPSSVLHSGVVCDGCNGPIQGCRFKCIECQDFDLCANCESCGLHSNHSMIRLVKPINVTAYFGRRFVRHMNKFAKKQSQYDDTGDENQKEKDNKKDNNAEHGDKFRNRKFQKRRQRPQQIDGGIIGSIIADLINNPPTLNNGQFTEFTLNDEGKFQAKNCSKDASNSTEKPDKGSKDEDFKIPKIGAGIRMLKVIGDNITQVLDPLGVDRNAPHVFPIPIPIPMPSCSKSNGETATPKKSSTNEADNDTAEKGEKNDPGWTLVYDSHISSDSQSDKSSLNDPTETQSNHSPNTETGNFTEKSNDASKSADAEAPKLDQDPLLKLIGQNLSEFLDPLGIDVNSLVNGIFQNITKRKTDQPNPSCSKSSSGAETPVKKSEDEVINAQEVTNEAANVNLNAGKKINPKPIIDEVVKSIAEKDEQSDPSWTLVNEVASEGTGKESPKEQTTRVYPQLPQEPISYHPDPKINAAIKIMIDMGFSNNDGQLAKYLAAANGDIVSVLDILHQFK